MFWTRTFVFFAVFFLLCTTAVSKTKVTNVKAAKKAYAKGAAHYEKKECRQAAAAFREAFQLNPHWALLYNIGQSEDCAHNYGIALESFEEALSQAGEDVDEDRYDALIKDIKRLREMVAYVTVDAPDESTVFIDDIERGTTPLAGPVTVSAAKNITIRVVHKNTVIKERTARVGGRKTLAVNARTHLQVECDVPDAVVYVDDQSMGNCPFDGDISPGVHRIAVNVAGYDDFVKEINVKPGSSSAVEVKMKKTGGDPVAAAEQSTGGKENNAGKPFIVSGIVSLSAGVVGVGVGGGFTVSALLHTNDGRNADTQAGQDAATSNLEKDKIGMIVGYAAGGALVITGVVMLVVGKKTQ